MEEKDSQQQLLSGTPSMRTRKLSEVEMTINPFEDVIQSKQHCFTVESLTDAVLISDQEFNMNILGVISAVL